MKRFIPVKITSKQWADKLMDGEVFFRPLNEFRPQESNLKEMKNNSRGDFSEGAYSVYTDLSKCEHVKGYSDDFKECVKQLITLDEDDAKYIKLFCMYALEYDYNNDYFIPPDKKVLEFDNADTVVVFRDFDAFLRRFINVLRSDDKFLLLADRINYYSANENRQLNPIFEKEKSYSWQNEFRLAYGDLIEVSPNDLRMVWELNRITFNIGDIRDIAVEIPIQDFVSLSFLSRTSLKFPMADEVKPPLMQQNTLLDLIVDDTRKKMSQHKCHLFKDQAIIY